MLVGGGRSRVKDDDDDGVQVGCGTCVPINYNTEAKCSRVLFEDNNKAKRAR